MVKRKAYKATVTVEVSGQVVNGEWMEGRKDVMTIKGHYEPSSDARVIIRRNASGDEKQVRGFFFPGKKPKLEGVPVRLAIAHFDIDADIICWDDFQSHSIINI